MAVHRRPRTIAVHAQWKQLPPRIPSPCLPCPCLFILRWKPGTLAPVVGVKQPWTWWCGVVALAPMAGIGEALVSAVLKEVLRHYLGFVLKKITLEHFDLFTHSLFPPFETGIEFQFLIEQGKISSSFAKFSMSRKLKSMREKLTRIAAQRSQFGFMLDTCSTYQEEIKKRETTSKISRATIVGRQKEKMEIVRLLSSNCEQKTLVVPIFVFGGIGKTTLAKLVFNDDQMQKIDLRAWVYVSPHFELNMIGKSIVSQIEGHVDGLHDLQSVSNCLEEKLGGRSCLIVLDDLWENNCFQLCDLVLMLSNFKKESMVRVIVTTRTEEVARKIGTVTPYKLEPLSDDQCWTLFKHIAFSPGCTLGEDEKNVLENIGRDIANKCQGVPMAAQALGFMLRNKAVEEWKNVRDSDIWSGSSATTDDVLPSLKLSYYQMSPYLKLCFSYCSVFPKGFEIHRGNLIRQWISLGFIPSSPEEHMTPEKIGETYVNELLGMSFVQYSSLTSLSTKEDTKNSMLLRMHDLMHDLGRSVIGDELLLMNGEKEYSSGHGNYRGLCSLPEPFGEVINLQHLDLADCYNLSSLPNSFGSLCELQYLNLSGMSSNISRLQFVNPSELEIECLENVTRIEEVDVVNLANKSALAKLVLSWTPALEHFVEDGDLLRELQPPENLMFLKVQGYMANSFSGWVMGMASCLPHLVCIEMVDLPRCEHLPPFGQLQNLEELTIKRMPILRKLGTEFCGGSGAFKKLREFTLIDLDTLEEWVTKVSEYGEYMFPILQKLEICRCPRLRLKPCLPRTTEWRIQASDGVIATQYDAASLFSSTLSKLHVTSCNLLPDKWTLFEFLPTLEILEISNYQLRKLPDSLVFLVSLRLLKIDVSTDNQEELSDWLTFLSAISSDWVHAVFPLPNLTALENLEISLNDESQRWCKKHDRWTLENVKNKPTTFFERQVANMRKKEGQSLISYIGAVKQLADTLAAVGQTLHDKDVIRFILDHRLGLADLNLITLITNGKDDIILNDLYDRLVRHEKRFARSQFGETSANFTTGTNSHEMADISWSEYSNDDDVGSLSLVSDELLTDLDSYNGSDGMYQSENELQDLPSRAAGLHH
ncbi:hypothetical protein HU200_062359 [Digitaria exilis]|uniref:NB-ARC domain-containing protein n=1 Tax=Digitaria exilis TaxID=1010633 RepID=A0A835AA23_9POAL|nr:hypothetical protein HU200_062359 [Digitaria exilis]